MLKLNFLRIVCTVVFLPENGNVILDSQDWAASLGLKLASKAGQMQSDAAVKTPWRSENDDAKNSATSINSQKQIIWNNTDWKFEEKLSAFQ